jgi:hypothetical protein
MARKRLGELLLEKGALTQPQLDACLTAQKQTHERLGVLLVQKGYVSEELLASALSEALEIPLASFDQPVDWSAVHMLRPRFCEQNDLFPWGMVRSGNRKQLVVAMADPLNAPAISEIEFTTGLSVSVRLATLSAIRGAILRYYHKGRPPPVTAAASSTPADDEPMIVVGEEIAAPEPKSAIKEDLAFLFGSPVDAEALEKLEKKFWALVRVMSRKGLITKDEFARELEESEG